MVRVRVWVRGIVPQRDEGVREVPLASQIPELHGEEKSFIRWFIVGRKKRKDIS